MGGKVGGGQVTGGRSKAVGRRWLAVVRAVAGKKSEVRSRRKAEGPGERVEGGQRVDRTLSSSIMLRQLCPLFIS